MSNEYRAGLKAAHDLLRQLHADIYSDIRAAQPVLGIFPSRRQLELSGASTALARLSGRITDAYTASVDDETAQREKK